MITTIGSLVMVGLNTPSPQVFWKGSLIPNIVGIRVDWEDDEQKVRLKVTNILSNVHSEMSTVGIVIKEVSK